MTAVYFVKRAIDIHHKANDPYQENKDKKEDVFTYDMLGVHAAHLFIDVLF